jgi:hypothetical protein
MLTNTRCCVGLKFAKESQWRWTNNAIISTSYTCTTGEKNQAQVRRSEWDISQSVQDVWCKFALYLATMATDKQHEEAPIDANKVHTKFQANQFSGCVASKVVGFQHKSENKSGDVRWPVVFNDWSHDPLGCQVELECLSAGVRWPAVYNDWSHDSWGCQVKLECLQVVPSAYVITLHNNSQRFLFLCQEPHVPKLDK